MTSIERFGIYWFDPEPVRGSEIKKIRPCVVVSPGVMNNSLQTVIIAPLTTVIRPWSFRVNVKVLGRSSSVACDQIRAVDKSRLKEQIDKLPKLDGEKILAILKLIFEY